MKLLKATPKVCRTQGSSGFTLVELMVVVAIIGILAAVAGPRVQSFRAKGVQSEARSNLHSIYLSMLAFEDANDRFPNINLVCPVGVAPCQGAAGAAEAITFVARPDYKYAYGIVSVPANSRWVAGAASRRPLLAGQLDKWLVNTNKVLCSQTDVTVPASVAAVNTGAGPTGCAAIRGAALAVADTGLPNAPNATDDKQ